MHFDKIINTAYSFGAAIVVFGAWGKMEHKASGDTALTVGLLVETGIFFIYGLMEWRRKPGQEEPGKGDRPVGGEVDKNAVEMGWAERSGRDASGSGTDGHGMRREDAGELTNALKQTNQLLGRIFRAD